MVEEIQRYIKYKILRYRAAKIAISDLTDQESRILKFVKSVIRNSDSIIITLDLIKVSKNSLSLTFDEGRLIVMDEKSIMDIKVGELTRRAILEYANRVIRYRNTVFTKCCNRQISNLLDGFET